MKPSISAIASSACCRIPAGSASSSQVNLPRPRDQLVDPRTAGIPAAAAAIVRLHQGDRAVTSDSAKDKAKALILPLAVLLAFEAWARATHLQSDSLAPPSAIAIALAGAFADFSILAATRDTLFSAFAGLAIGTVDRARARHRLRDFGHAQPADGSDGRGDPADPLDRAAADRADRARLRLPHGNRDRGVRLRLADPDPEPGRGARHRTAADGSLAGAAVAAGAAGLEDHHPRRTAADIRRRSGCRPGSR